MTHRAEFEAVMKRIQSLEEYEIEIVVPDEFQFDGPVPFDMEIAGGVAWVKVIAASMEEAKFKVYEYFESKYK
jgi:hypothetical protein